MVKWFIVGVLVGVLCTLLLTPQPMNVALRSDVIPICVTETPTALPTSTPTSISTPIPAYDVRINVGGAQYGTWVADRSYTGYGYTAPGGTFATTSAIAGTTEDTIYQTERYWLGSAGYRFDVANGQYKVDLKFAEIYQSSVGARVFDVSIEGIIVVSNLDIFARVGKNVALDLSYTTNVTDGRLDVVFTAKTDTAKVNAIRVTSVSVPVTPTSTPTATPMVSTTRGGYVFTGPGSIDNGSTYIAPLNASWWYNYNPILWQTTTTGIPLIHSWTSDINLEIALDYVPQGSYVLVFNEPDRSDQENLTPAAAAVAYHRIRETLLSHDPNIKFIVGGVSNLNTRLVENGVPVNPMTGYYGLRWLVDMAKEYQTLYGTMPADGYAAHLYLCAGDYSQYTYQQSIMVFHDALIANSLTGQFWLTETGCLSNDATAQLLLSENRTWLNTTPYVDRWAWFATYVDWGSGSLLTGTGELTNLGKSFKGN